jgi:predicted HTH transcriptional regulator
MDQATVFFNSLTDLNAIKQLVVERTQENIYLELKTKKDRSCPDLGESDAWQFSRALSGFANSDGGVLVWGIETDKEERASKLKPISSAVDFESRLKKSLLNTVQPFVDGILIATILEDGGDGTGYVKVLVPRSEKTPHRAMLAGREYYRRSRKGSTSWSTSIWRMPSVDGRIPF